MLSSGICAMSQKLSVNNVRLENTVGNEALSQIMHVMSIRVGVQICYDILRFHTDKAWLYYHVLSSTIKYRVDSTIEHSYIIQLSLIVYN